MADVAVGGIRLHVQRLGPTDGPDAGRPAVLFVHGLVMDNLASWYFTVANPVATHRPVILYDLRGHGLSERPPTGYGLQTLVAENVGNQILEGNSSIVGLMLESNLHWGQQPIPANRAELQYGVSVPDACIDWETTEGLLQSLDARLRAAPRIAKGPAAA